MTRKNRNGFRTISVVAVTAVGLVLSACGGSSEEAGSAESSEPVAAVDLRSAPSVAFSPGPAGLPQPASSVGPSELDPVPHGFEHSPQGAVVAGINAQVWLAGAGDEVWPDVSQQLVAAGVGRDQWAQARSLVSVDGSVTDPTTFEGFKVTEYDEDGAIVLLAMKSSSGVLTAYPVQLVWRDDDWKVVLPTQDTAPDLVEIDTLDGYSLFDS